MELKMNQQDLQVLAAEVVEMLKPHLQVLKKPDNEEVIMGVQELAVYLGMSDKWVYDQTSSQRIPYFKLGAILKFRKTVIDKWMRSFDMPAVDKPTAFMKLVKG